MYLQAYEWEFVAEREYKSHKYPWSGNPERLHDQKDNNPYDFHHSVPFPGRGEIYGIDDILTAEWNPHAKKDTVYRNYLDINDNQIFDEGDIVDSTVMSRSALRGFIRDAIEEAKNKNILLS